MVTPYPNTPFDRGESLLATLGSFWASTYAGRDQVLTHVTALAQGGNQSLLDVLETINNLSRYSVSIYHRENWTALTLLESQRNDASTSLLKYDAGAFYDTGYRYDVVPPRADFAFPRPPRLAGVRTILNRFTSPSLVWTRGVDFDLVTDAIVFAADPFADARVAKRDVYGDNGDVVDREAILWLFRGDFDWDAIYRQFGYVIGMRLRSSRGYRDLLNAVFDAIVGGTVKQQITTAFSVVTGIPLVKEPAEQVEDIWMQQGQRLVITDKNVYHLAADAEVTVAVGDVVHAGDTLSDGLQFIEFNRGLLPDDILAMSVGKSFTNSCFYGDLIFENREVPLTVITDDPSGFTKLTWSLGGVPADVEAFFDEMHRRGVLAAQTVDACDDGPQVSYPGDGCDTFTTQRRKGTLAHLLDRRENPKGEPTAANLPRTINPLRFMVQNVWRNNAYAVKIKVAQLLPGGLGLHNLRYLRKIVPPHTALLLLIETSPQADTIDRTRWDDEVETFTAVQPIEDEVGRERVDEQIQVRHVYR